MAKILISSQEDISNTYSGLMGLFFNHQIRLTVLLLFATALSTQGQNGYQSSLKVRPLNHSQTVTALADGGLLISSIIEDSSSVYEGYNLTRLDYNGSIVWSYNYNTLNDFDLCYYPLELSDGSIVISGTASGSIRGGIILTQLDSAGSIVWSRTIESTANRGVFGYGRVLETKNKGLIVSGFIDLGNSNSDNYIIQLDSLGNMVWAKRYGGIGYENNSRLTKTQDGGYLLTSGTRFSFNNQYTDFLIVKLDSIGNVQWTKTYGSINNDDPWSAEQTPDKGYVIAGRSYSYGPPAQLVIKTDSIGNVQWARTYQNVHHGLSAKTAADQSILLSVTLNDSVGYPSVGMIKTNSLGNIIWSKRYGHATYGTELDFSLGSSYLIAGVSTAYNELLIVKTDTNGNSGCPQQNIPVTSTLRPLSGTSVTLLTDTVTTIISPRQTVSSTAFTIYDKCISSISVNEISNDAEKSFLIYPVPTEGPVTIYNSNSFTASEIRVYTVLGKLIYQNILNGDKLSLDLSPFANGTYILNIICEDEVIRKKIIVKR